MKLLRWFYELSQKDTPCEDAKRMKSLDKICALGLTLMSASCSSRVIYVPSGQPLRLAEPVKVRVWTLDSSGQAVMSKNKVLIPEGWYALPKE